MVDNNNATPLDPAPREGDSSYKIARVASFIILALVIVAIVFALSQAVFYWDSISVANPNGV